MKLLTERHADEIRGVLSCLDRIVVTGTIPHICHGEGMSGFLWSEGIRIFDFPQWAKKLRDEIRANADKIAQKNGIEIEFMRKSTFRKEDRVKEVVAKRGTHPGLVHILSVMESCPSYKP
jgi:hypothetical protein